MKINIDKDEGINCDRFRCSIIESYNQIKLFIHSKDADLRSSVFKDKISGCRLAEELALICGRTGEVQANDEPTASAPIQATNGNRHFDVIYLSTLESL